MSRVSREAELLVSIELMRHRPQWDGLARELRLRGWRPGEPLYGGRPGGESLHTEY